MGDLLARPAHQRLARLLRPATMDERGERLGSGFRLTPCEPRQAGEHGMRLLEPDIADLGAVPRAPAQRRAAEPSRVVDHEEDELERLGKAHEIKLGRGRVGDGRVLRIEGAAEAAVGGALRSHEQMFSNAPMRVASPRILSQSRSSE